MSNHLRAARAVLVVMLIATGLLSIVLSAQSRGSANRSAVAPRNEFVKRTVDEAYARFRSDTSGKNADYIPYLAQVDSKLFGVSVVTTDNQSYSVGDTTYAFSMQGEPRPSGSGFRKGTNPAVTTLGSRS